MSRRRLVFLTSALALLIATAVGMLVLALASRDKWPSNDEYLQSNSPLAVAMRQNKEQTVLDEIQAVVKQVPAADATMLNRWVSGAPHSPAEIAAYLAAGQDIAQEVSALEKGNLPGRVEQLSRLHEPALGFDASPVRHAVMLLCEAGEIAHTSGDDAAAARHILAALAIADSLAPLRSATAQMSRDVCVGMPIEMARHLYEERAPDRATALQMVAAVNRSLSPEKFAGTFGFIDNQIGLSADLVDYRFQAIEITSYADDSDNPVSYFFRKVSELLGFRIENKSRKELAAIQQKDLSACRALRDLARASSPWPRYASMSNESWKKVMSGRFVPNTLPIACFLQTITKSVVGSYARVMAEGGVLRILVVAQLFESQNHRLPNNLVELQAFARTDPEISAALGPSQSFWTDPYSGRPYGYSLDKNSAGKPVLLKIYSVGPDLKNNGGTPVSLELKRYYSGMTAAAKPLTESAVPQ